MGESTRQKAFRRVTIIGTGAIGCSIGSQIQGQGLAEEVVGVDRSAAHLEMARRLGFIHRGISELNRGVIGSEAVILAVPLDEVYLVLSEAGPHMRPGAMITCTAGTTFKLWRQITDEVPSVKQFVPSFPLVYSTSIGPGAASGNLLLYEPCLVAKSESFAAEDIARVRQFWSSLQMSPETLDMERFEWGVAGRFLWPQLISATVYELAQKRDITGGSTAMARWLEAMGTERELGRTFQLYAVRLGALLQELQQELARIQDGLGKKPTEPKSDAKI